MTMYTITFGSSVNPQELDNHRGLFYESGMCYTQQHQRIEGRLKSGQKEERAARLLGSNLDFLGG
jgi:hypothetical protein